MRGTFAAFSEKVPFTFTHHRNNLYRCDFKVLGEPAIRGRDKEGHDEEFIVGELKLDPKIDEPFFNLPIKEAND